MQLRGSKVHIFFLHTWRESVQRVRSQGRPALSWVLRLTVAATAAYIVAMQVMDDQPLLAPLSALLVSQLTLYSSVRHGVKRVGAVMIGVLLATLFASAVGLSWWSLAIVIAVGLLIGQMFRLGDYVIEVPVTAMFVMAVQVGTSTAALDRLLSTAIGAAVGLLINILVPPGERSPNAAAAIRRYADDIADTIKVANSQMDGEITREQAQSWLNRARSLDYKSVHIDRMIDHAEEARVLNLRALNRPDSIGGLRNGLYALEHSAVTVRGVFRGISDAVWYPDEEGTDALPPGPRAVTCDVLDCIADVVTEFGVIVEAHIYGPLVKSDAALDRSMKRLNEARLTADARLDSKVDPLAVRELLAFVVVAAGRVLREFDLRSHRWLGLTPREADKPKVKRSAVKEIKAHLRFRRPKKHAPVE